MHYTIIFLSNLEEITDNKVVSIPLTMLVCRLLTIMSIDVHILKEMTANHLTISTALILHD